jgi:hypothetical protein
MRAGIKSDPEVLSFVLGLPILRRTNNPFVEQITFLVGESSSLFRLQSLKDGVNRSHQIALFCEVRVDIENTVSDLDGCERLSRYFQRLAAGICDSQRTHLPIQLVFEYLKTTVRPGTLTFGLGLSQRNKAQDCPPQLSDSLVDGLPLLSEVKKFGAGGLESIAVTILHDHIRHNVQTDVKDQVA